MELLQVMIDAVKGTYQENYTKGQTSDAIRNALIEANGGSNKINIKNFYRGSQVYSLIEELIPTIIDEGFKDEDVIFSLVDYRNIADGDEQEFEIENESGLDSFPIVSQLNEEHTETRRNYRFLLGFACGVACAAVICLCAYLFFFEKWVATVSEEKNTEVSVQAETSGQLTDADVRQVPKPDVLDSDKKDLIEASDADSKNEQMAKTEQTAEVPTRPSDEPVYDTITKTRYLTTMAKEHYGNYNLWPYIYEENKAILGHPDRIRPGTKVIVPPLSKYGVNPSDPDDIAKAKKKGVEIYAHYQ